MLLYKLEDFNPNYRQDAFDGEDIKGLPVYAGKTNEKIGIIHDALVDETGLFRYLVIDTGFWIFGKKVLLPVGRCRVEPAAQRIYALGITSKEQAEQLPEYDDSMTVDYDYEERVRRVYRTPIAEASMPLAGSEAAGVADPASVPYPVYNQVNSAPYDRNTYTYEQEPALYQMNERDHQRLKLYEERLVVNKNRRKTGEVTIGKRVEAETARASVPVEKERVVIERTTPEGAATPVMPDNTAFQEGAVAHMNIYEEAADIRKQAFVREEVAVRKEVKQDMVEATETLRHEELDVNTEGR